jgi:acyl-CoA synthetase (NDP forming)
VAPALARDPSIDMLIAIFTLIPESSLDAAGLFTSLRSEFPAKPMAAVLMAGEAAMHLEWKRSIEDVGVPTFTSPERAMRALGALWKYAKHSNS